MKIAFGIKLFVHSVWVLRLYVAPFKTNGFDLLFYDREKFILYFAMYNAHFFGPYFRGKNKDAYYTYHGYSKET